MGFEYKLKTKLTEKQISEIQDLLEDIETFDKKYKLDNKLFRDFRNSENKGKMPNTNIIFENDGIYICQYVSSFLWTGLNKLKDYIEINKIEYEIIDLQE